MNKIILISIFLMAALTFKGKAQKTAYTMPEVNKILKGVHLYVNIELDDSTKAKINFNNSHYLNPLTNYIDYNVIGKGQVAVIDEDKLREFIIKGITEGKKLDQIGKALINEFNREAQEGGASAEKEDLFNIGGFFSGEMEYHEEPNGKFEFKTELNQLRIYFASHINSKSKNNNVSVFAEYNPVPEEVIHQVEEAVVTKGVFQDTLRQPDISAIAEGAPVPFERLFVNVTNVGGTKLNLTFGQFRTPFGLWSDFTSHRNFTSTKNNTLVNGFALKKIELGLKLDYKINTHWDIEAAIVNGRFGRTAPLYRDDNDNKKDFVTHVTYTGNRFSAGASAYLAEFALDKRTAYGIDFGYRLDKLLLSGEFVIQRNKQLAVTASNIAPFINELSSNSAYLQFDYELSHSLHIYGMYDYWKLNADKQTVNRAAFKVFHGLKYFINPKTRWTIIEYGYVGHKGFDNGKAHLSTQLEINF
jgi:hypothetical protein